MSIHSFSMRLPKACPDPATLALTAMRAQVEASGYLIENLDALVPEVATDDYGFAVLIPGIEATRDPAFDEPCEFCE